MNITVRANGLITMTRTDQEFMDMMANVYGHGKSLEEYIDLYNEADGAKKAGLCVHKEVEAGMY